MSHMYGAAKEENKLTPVSLTPGEERTGMTTAESATNMDTSSPDYTGTEKKKPSLLKKVKAKAKKLKSKLKPGHHETETPTRENDGSSSSSGEEEETEELGYTPLGDAVNMDDDKTTAHAQPAPQEPDYSDKQSGLGGGYGVPHEDRKFGLLDSPDQKGRLATEDPAAPGSGSDSIPLSQLKNPGPPGVEQAVPTSYNYYNTDPSDAYKTLSSAAPGIDSGDTEVIGEDTPSALGGESKGVTPVLSGSNAFGGAGDRSFPSGGFSPHDNSNRSADRSYEEDRDAKIPESMLTPGAVETESRQGQNDETLSGEGYDQDVGMATPSSNVTGTLAGVKDGALDKLGYGSSDDRKTTSEYPSTGDYSTQSQKPLHQRAYEGVTGAAVGMGQKLGVYRDYDHPPSESTSSSEPTIGQKAYDTIVGTKDAAAEKLSGGDGSYTQSGQPTVGQKAYESVLGTKDAAADKLGYNSQSSGQPTVAQKAYETVLGTKDAAADKLGYNSQSSAGSTGGPTLTQKAYDSIVGTKDAAASKLPVGDSSSTEPSIVQKAYDSVVGAKGATADKLGAQSGTTASHPQTGSFFDSSAAPVSEFNSSTESKPLTEKAGETAASWKDTIANTLGLGGGTSTKDLTASTATSTDQKPLTEKLTETGVGVKETVATKLGYEGSYTHTPGEQMVQTAKERAIEAKNIAADKLGQADVALSSDATPVSTKAGETVYAAKDSTVSTVTPTEGDKALAQSVTENISNLPNLLTQKLGLGGNSSTTPSPSTTTKDYQGPSELDIPVSDNKSTLSTAADTPDSAAASPGIVNRVTGAVSSLFGGGKRTTAGGEEYSPTVSPSGSGRRDVTDTSPMVTDLGGESTPHSSPAA